jgi:hypothetical protein
VGFGGRSGEARLTQSVSIFTVNFVEVFCHFDGLPDVGTSGPYIAYDRLHIIREALDITKHPHNFKSSPTQKQHWLVVGMFRVLTACRNIAHVLMFLSSSIFTTFPRKSKAHDVTLNEP